MPGLVGIVSENAVDEQLLDRMVNSTKHEKFHRVDKYNSSHFGIARVHLGIFNPEPQPIFNEDQSLCIFMDGKIYDYGEEMTKLKDKHEIVLDNDPEFCLHSYEEYGIDFVKNLNGTFVFVICDLKENKIIIANGRYGLRPLYYAMNNGKLLFASEIKAILEDKKFKKELNDEAVSDFFAFGGDILGEKTFFKGIQILPPASIFIYTDKGKVSLEQYWDFNYEPDYSKSKDDFVDELVKTFKRAVKIRMKDNLRYGVSLSGGLDSRVVAGAIDENKRKDVLSFSFGPLDCDEVKIAKKVAKRAGTKFKAIPITPEMIIENAEKYIYLNDGLDYMGNSFSPSIARIFGKNINIIFDGFALDLTLGGSYLINVENHKDLFTVLYKKRFFSDEELSKLFVENYYEKIKRYPLLSFTDAFEKIKTSHPRNKSDYFALQNHVRRLTVMGIVLAQNYVEYAHPTYDNDFIELILTIPPELRFNYHIYRKFFKKLSPELAKIPYNKTMIRADAPLLFWKIGRIYQFGKESIKKWIWRFSKGKILFSNKRSYVNFDEWLRTNENWQSYFRELLLNKNSKSGKYFNQNYVNKLLQEQEEGKKDNSLKLLYLASFELFLRLFFSHPYKLNNSSGCLINGSEKEREGENL